MGAVARTHRIRTPLALALVLALAGSASAVRNADAADQVASPASAVRRRPGPGVGHPHRAAALPRRAGPRHPRRRSGSPSTRPSGAGQGGPGRHRRRAPGRPTARPSPAPHRPSCHLPVQPARRDRPGGVGLAGRTLRSTPGTARRSWARSSTAHGVRGRSRTPTAAAGTATAAGTGPSARCSSSPAPGAPSASTATATGSPTRRTSRTRRRPPRRTSATAGATSPSPAALRPAILSYNHSAAYRRLVLTYQQRFAALGLDQGISVVGLSTVVAAGAPVAGTAIGEARQGTRRRRRPRPDEPRRQQRRVGRHRHAAPPRPPRPVLDRVGEAGRHPTAAAHAGGSPKPSGGPGGGPKPRQPHRQPGGSPDRQPRREPERQPQPHRPADRPDDLSAAPTDDPTPGTQPDPGTTDPGTDRAGHAPTPRRPARPARATAPPRTRTPRPAPAAGHRRASPARAERHRDLSRPGPATAASPSSAP